MGLNFKKWLLEKLGGEEQRVTSAEITGEEFFDLASDLYVREIAFWSCVNTVANAVSKCEFKTFMGKKEVREEEYYTWNMEPNRNQNASAFIHKWISKLYQDNEALVLEQNGQLLVADSFTRKAYALYDDTFTGVAVEDFTFKKTFTGSEVLYFKLSEKDMRRVTNGLYLAYQKLIDYSMRSYQKSRGSRGILDVSAMAQGSEKYEENFNKLMNEHFKNFFNAENAVLPLFEGYRYTDIGSKTYSNEGTRDIRAMIDDVSDFTAKAFGIPPALLNGTVQGTSEATDHFLTFCIDPLCRTLQEEINRKRYGYAGFKNGNYVQIDTKAIKHVDLLSVSTAIDKLIASGAFCINDIRKLTGETIIDEAWANQHFMTKNYATVADLLESLQEGGTL